MFVAVVLAVVVVWIEARSPVQPFQFPSSYRLPKPHVTNSYGGYKPNRDRPSASLDCTKLEDGNYPNPSQKCSQKYLTCSNGWGVLVPCAANMYYNKKIRECDLYVYVPACGGKDRPVVQKEPTPPGPKSRPHPDFDCRRLANGEYEDKLSKCSRRWFGCLNGHTTERLCGNDLYYDVKSKSCQRWVNVYKCSGKQSRPNQVVNDFARPQPVPVNCESLPDGEHPDPKSKCSKTFYQCSYGNGYKRTCPDETYFNPLERTCDEFHNIYACSGLKPKPIQKTPPHRYQPKKNYPFSCKNKRDGNYPAGKCKPFYWSCTSGETDKMSCYEKLVYDAELDICDQKKHIPKCGGRRPQKEQLPKPDKRINFDCSRREEGKYPAGDCKSFYFSCSGNAASKTICPAGLKYDSDPQYEVCDEPKFIPKCGGKRRPKPNNFLPKPNNFLPKPHPFTYKRPQGNSYRRPQKNSYRRPEPPRNLEPAKPFRKVKPFRGIYGGGVVKPKPLVFPRVQPEPFRPPYGGYLKPKNVNLGQSEIAYG